MSLPDLVRTTLDDEPVLERIALGGEDELLVTPARLLRYRAEGLLSDESIEGFPRDAERVSASVGRRTATITLGYADRERTLSVPADRFEDVLGPLLEGVLAAAGVTDDDERTLETFRFDELTVVVTDRRLVEHVGAAVWDGEYEEIPFGGVTGLDVERGRLATGVVLTADGRRHRLKIRNERARSFEERVRAAIREFHGVGSIDELDADDEPAEPTGDAAPTVAGVAPLGIDRSEERSTDGDVATPAEAGDPIPPREVGAELEALASAIERQEVLLAEQHRAIDRLRGALTRARDR